MKEDVSKLNSTDTSWSVQLSPHRLWFVNFTGDNILFTRYRPQARRFDLDEAVRLKEILVQKWGCGVITICRNNPPLALVVAD